MKDVVRSYSDGWFNKHEVFGEAHPTRKIRLSRGEKNIPEIVRGKSELDKFACVWFLESIVSWRGNYCIYERSIYPSVLFSAEGERNRKRKEYDGYEHS